MSLFPRVFANEFAPLFRLVDDYTTHAVIRGSVFGTNQIRSFQPRFDVTENKDSYELKGDLPGVARDNLTIEFIDHRTLSIKGRTGSVREEGTRPGQPEASQPSAAIETADTPSDAASENSNYHKASVEDEDGFTSISNDGEVPQPSQPQTPPAQAEVPVLAQSEQSRYWVSERSVGSFARSFQFPSRIDQDNVKASLSNGILSIVVPKSAIPQSRRINVE